ncbi:mechanosensitive ion channel family protein [Candidatus Dependentiae bacterium]|nr:mechanosensitive ion channel family protein [Candidatus Dependentiae bacterium]
MECNLLALQSFLESTSMVLIVLGISFLLARLVRKGLDKLEESPDAPAELDTAHVRFAKHFVVGFIYFIGIGIAISLIPPLKSVAFSLLASTGVLTLVIGFASQQAFSNIISGLFLGIFKPFVIGNHIKLVKDNIEGTVEDITLRHTIIKTAENKHIMIPNAVMNAEIVENTDWADASWADGKIHKYIEIPLNYNIDLTKALDIIHETLANHPLIIDNRSAEQKKRKEALVEVHVIKLTPSAIIARGAAWTKGEAEGYKLACDVYKTVKDRFEKEEITFPRCYCSGGPTHQESPQA